MFSYSIFFQSNDRINVILTDTKFVINQQNLDESTHALNNNDNFLHFCEFIIFIIHFSYKHLIDMSFKFYCSLIFSPQMKILNCSFRGNLSKMCLYISHVVQENQSSKWVRTIEAVSKKSTEIVWVWMGSLKQFWFCELLDSNITNWVWIMSLSHFIIHINTYRSYSKYKTQARLLWIMHRISNDAAHFINFYYYWWM